MATIVPAPEGSEAAAASVPSEGPEFTSAVAKIGFAVQFLRNGLGNWQGKVLMPVFVGMLPHLLQAQVGSVPLACRPAASIARSTVLGLRWQPGLSLCTCAQH